VAASWWKRLLAVRSSSAGGAGYGTRAGETRCMCGNWCSRRSTRARACGSSLIIGGAALRLGASPQLLSEQASLTVCELSDPFDLADSVARKELARLGAAPVTLAGQQLRHRPPACLSRTIEDHLGSRQLSGANPSLELRSSTPDRVRPLQRKQLLWPSNHHSHPAAPRPCSPCGRRWYRSPPVIRLPDCFLRPLRSVVSAPPKHARSVVCDLMTVQVS
jgi:hypothetical protein